MTNNILDRIVFLLVILLAALPFGQLVTIPLPGLSVSAFEFLWLSLLLVLLTRILVKTRVYFWRPLFVFALTVTLALMASVLVYRTSPILAVDQLRKYLPFTIALLIYAAGTTIVVRYWVSGLLAAAIVSVLGALVIHYMFPGLLVAIFQPADGSVSAIASHGRLYWSNASLAFVALLVAVNRDLVAPRWLVLLAVILTVLGMLNTVNRTMMLGYVLFLSSLIFAVTSWRSLGRTAGALIGLGIAIPLILGTLVAVNDRLAALIQLRIVNFGGLEAGAENSAVLGRVGIYQQYWESLQTHFPLGQGLGRPFFDSALTGQIFTSDVSLMSFILPFGLAGAIAFFVYLWQTIVIVQKLRPTLSKTSRLQLLFFIGVFFLMALNIDFFAQNNFVIFFAVLLMGLHRTSLNQIRQSVDASESLTAR